MYNKKNNLSKNGEGAMKFIRRAVSLLLAAVCAVGALAGCSFGGESDKLVINEIMTKTRPF